MWVSTFARSPSRATRSQSSRLRRLAAGDVSSRYSTPNASSRPAISTFWSLSKKALANCSPSRSVDSMIAG